jgi:hypothetical protein
LTQKVLTTIMTCVLSLLTDRKTGMYRSLIKIDLVYFDGLFILLLQRLKLTENVSDRIVGIRTENIENENQES